MNDIEEIPVETVRGATPSSAVGDRLLIGLAILALCGGLFIAAGNLVGPLLDDPAAMVSAAPSSDATTRPQSTPRPSRTPRPLREVTLVPGEPPSQPTSDDSPMYWVEILVETAVRGAPIDGASAIRFLDEGDIVLATPRSPDDLTWFAVQETAEGGWIRSVTGDRQPTARYGMVAQGYFSGGVTGIAPGPDGFVAHGHAPGGPFVAPAGLTLHSSDGEGWTIADRSVQDNWGGWAAAYGPSGWLAASAVDDGRGDVVPWIWEAADGSQWTPVGHLPDIGAGFPTGLVANESGYLLAFASRGSERGELWFSPDGVTWQESGDTGLSGGSGNRFFGSFDAGLFAADGGFLAWTSNDAPFGPAEVAFSRNGRSWEAMPLGIDPIAMFDLVVVGDSVLAIGLDEDGRIRAWSGRIADDGPAMAAAPQFEAAFSGTIVTSLVADDDRAYAFGYERDGGAARAWTSAGAGWLPLAVPDGGFGTTPRIAAAGTEGVVVAGARSGVLASSPVFWHLRSDGRWMAEPTAVFPSIADPEPGQCPPLPETAFDFMTLEAGLAVACFGDAQISFISWSGVCDGCWGGEPPRLPGPDWLRAPAPFLVLLPVDGDANSGWWRQGVLHPDLGWREEWTNTWVRVTGHFDDPAAARCGDGPDEGAEAWWQGPDLDVLYCRHAFVVTAVKVLARDGS